MPSRSVALFVLAMVVAAPTLAGELNPPGGAVAETMKTLQQVEPRTPINMDNTPGDTDIVFKITASGSYYLTRNVSTAGIRSGIEVAVSNVTIDLMGFSVFPLTGGSIGGITGAVSGCTHPGRGR